MELKFSAALIQCKLFSCLPKCYGHHVNVTSENFFEIFLEFYAILVKVQHQVWKYTHCYLINMRVKT